MIYCLTALIIIIIIFVFMYSLYSTHPTQYWQTVLTMIIFSVWKITAWYFISLITFTWLNLMCTYPVQPMFAQSSCTSLFNYYLLSPQYTVLHILFHCTFYPLFFSYFYFFFIYIYFLLCYVSFLFIFCTVHWADLSWFTFHYWLYPV